MVIPVIEFVGVNFPAKRVAVNSKYLCRPRLVPIRALQHSFYEFFLKLPYRLIKQYSPLYHLAH